MEQIIPAFEIVRKIFLFTPLKKGAPGPSRSAVECSTTELYTPRQRTLALRSVGADAKMPFLEIYRMGQIILRNFYDARSHRHGCTRIPSRYRCALTPMHNILTCHFVGAMGLIFGGS
ncbi:hypothetical protein TNCV_4995101 [Trichonephila clavipes]|nr:hypothetical protein TNCV_4995101 [Trichonephila clavipes]